MLIDIVFAVLMVLAVWKGYSRGLIVGLFSLVAVIIGLAAAMKLSAVVAAYIGKSVKVSDEWLPVISFIVVFVGVILLIRLGANAIERTVEVVTLGWLNKLGGIVLYVAIYTIVFSILLFYAVQLKWLNQETIQHSVTYQWIQPIGPAVINTFGSLIPFFRDMFAELESFFDRVAKEITP